MAGIQNIPLRIPKEIEDKVPGFSRWFLDFVRDYLVKLDARNAVGATGVTITGNPNEFATITYTLTQNDSQLHLNSRRQTVKPQRLPNDAALVLQMRAFR